MTLLQSGLAKSGAVYTIDQSLRFNQGDSPVLSRTPAGAGSRTAWTWSGWVKRADLNGVNNQIIFGSENASDREGFFSFQSGEQVKFGETGTDSSSYILDLLTTQVCRDVGAWYHLVFVWDSDNGVQADRARIYVNGSRVTDFATNTNTVGSGDSSFINGTDQHMMGKYVNYSDAATYKAGQYLAEVYFIDGQSLDASSFGETDSATNQWKPIDASGLTFGTNGFYQKYGTTTANTTFTDVSSYGHTITANGGMVNSAAQVKYGSSSALFGGDGSGDYLEIADSSAFDLGTGDFTLEAWVYPTSDGSYRKIFVSGGWGVGPDGEYDYIIDKTDSGALRIQLYDDSYAPYVSTTATMTLDAWNHVAAVRSGTTVSLYIDGTASGTMTTDYSLISHGNPQIGIQTDVSATTQMWDGYIAGVRISNSARYTGNFTPSTGPYTSDANTMFLLDTWDGGLGEDSSGNTNTFAVTNLVATDKMLDSPTNNFAVINALAGGDGSGGGQALSEGNLRDLSQTDNTGIPITFGIPSSGKWYFEWYIEDYGATSMLGLVAPEIISVSSGDASGVGFWLYNGNNGYIYGNGAYPAYGTYWGVDGNLVGVAVDMDNGALYFSLNNVWQNSGDPESGASKTGAAATDLLSTGYDWVPCFKGQNPSYQSIVVFNAGQDSSFAGNKTAQGNQDANEIGDFYYEPPTDYLALCSSNLSDPEIKLPGDNFNTVLWTGTGAEKVISVGFQPDMTWIKQRDNGTYYHAIIDAVRGATKEIFPNADESQGTETESLKSFDSDGFTVGSRVGINTSTGLMASWSWLGDGVDGGTLNEVGDIDSQVNVNTTAGISIATFTGNKTLAQTVGHGLGAIPDWLFLKNVSANGQSWRGYCIPYGTSKYKYLDRDSVWNDDSGNSGEPTSTTFKIDNSDAINGTDNTIVCYSFLSIEGFSKGGTYIGNGNADGTFVYTGFRPQWILTAGAVAWLMLDSKRDPYNVADERLYADSTAAVSTGTSIDILSNGFKARESSGCNVNAETYGYLAFAESPFKYANAR